MDKRIRDRFTSTGYKLLYHPQALSDARRGLGTPISVQIAPTSRCNLACSFCSNVNRAKHEDLSFSSIVSLLADLKQRGTKSVELTGGGDPTLYRDINYVLEICFDYEFDVGMISNGILLQEKIEGAYLNKLSWLRVSMNCLDYVDEVDIPQIKGTLGFSYVWNDRTNPDVLENLERHRKEYSPRYVRIVPNCQCSDEEQLENNRFLAAKVEQLNPPYFYQKKEFKKPSACYWGYFKPFVLHDGYVYPCSSVVLNDSADRKFHESFRWCSVEGLPYKYNMRMQSFPVSKCNHCVFHAQNQIISDLMEPIESKNFI